LFFHSLLLLEFPSNLFDNSSLWITFRVSGEVDEMSPRKQFLSVPYSWYADKSHNAANADTANTINGVPLTGLVQKDASENVSISGTMTANSFVGDGSQLTGITSLYDATYINSTGPDTMSANTYFPTLSLSNSGTGSVLKILPCNYAGIFIDSCGTDGIDICFTGDDGIQIDDASYYGFYLQHSHEDGLHIDGTGDDGIEVKGDDDGVYAITTDSADEYGVYTSDKIYGSNLTSRSINTIGMNTGYENLEPGDIVCIAGGYQTNVLEDNSKIPFINVEKLNSSNSQAIIGVVEHRVFIREEIENRKEGKESIVSKSFRYKDGNAGKNDYVSIVVFGPTDVKVNPQDNIKIGDSLTSHTGKAEKVRTTEINGITIAENVTVLGKALENSSGKEMIKVFVNCQ